MATSAKRTIDLDSLLTDIRAAMSESDLREKYELTAPQLEAAVKRLEDLGHLVVSDLRTVCGHRPPTSGDMQQSPGSDGDRDLSRHPGRESLPRTPLETPQGIAPDRGSDEARFRCSQCCVAMDKQRDPCPRCGGHSTVVEWARSDCDTSQPHVGPRPPAPSPERSGVSPWITVLGAVVCTTLVVGLIHLAAKRPPSSAGRNAGTSAFDSPGIQHFSEENFSTAVLETSQERPVVVEFYADWCTYCHQMEPILQQVALEMRGNAVIGKVHERNRELLGRYGVLGFPTLLIIRNGEVKERFVGGRSKDSLIQVLRVYARST